MSDLIGQIIGNCRLEAMIGSGGMGVVYRARHLYLDRLQAVKVLAPNLAHAPELRAAFHQEARLAAALDHPHIVRVYDSGEWHDRGYLVMEYLPGSSLADLIAHMERGGRRMPIVLALDLARQAAEGLAFAHRYDVIHSDIKPGNLLLQRDEARPGALSLKIGDFGLARLGSELLAVSNLSGTPLYLSPEQCQGQPPDARSDIYSLGLTLYEMLTGKSSISLGSYAEVVMRQIASQPVAPRQIRAEISPRVEALVLCCIAKTPADRPPSAAVLAEELGRILRLASAPEPVAG